MVDIEAAATAAVPAGGFLLLRELESRGALQPFGLRFRVYRNGKKHTIILLVMHLV